VLFGALDTRVDWHALHPVIDTSLVSEYFRPTHNNGVNNDRLPRGEKILLENVGGIDSQSRIAIDNRVSEGNEGQDRGGSTIFRYLHITTSGGDLI